MRTPVSLLERLRRPDDAEAWDRFVDLYTLLLAGWAGTEVSGRGGPSWQELQVADEVSQDEGVRNLTVLARKARVVDQLHFGSAQLVVKVHLEVLEKAGDSQNVAALHPRGWRPETDG
jgi:hypothetical protein